ncbi:IS66 family transposase zinc-finger binding domain-containing protein, partial [Paraburkholderia sabiae]
MAAQLAVQLADREREVGEKERELQYRQTRIDQLAALAKLLPFDDREFMRDTPERKSRQQRARRAPLPAHLPRTDIHHDADTTACHCGCELERIGEDISEKLDYTPGVFTVERHIRGKWVCRQCET